MVRVTAVTPLSDFRIHVKFDDGVEGEVDLSDRLFGPVFELLKDRRIFEQVAIDKFGVVCWPNGADLAPDAMHQKLLALGAAHA